MCLDKVRKRYQGNLRGSGYKLFGKREGLLFGDYFASCRYRPEKEWLDEKNYRENPDLNIIRASDLKKYKAGWHIFATLRGILAWHGLTGVEIRKVRYQWAHTIGTKNGYKVIVAKKILIEEGAVCV